MQTVAPRVEVHPASWWRWLLTGPVAGLLIGVVARAWMRWIAVEPEFTWSGTIAIVASFVVFFTAQATVRLVRARDRSPGRVAAMRALAGVLSLGLFGAAGAVMLPTVLFGSLATWRRRLRPLVRYLLVIPAIPAPVFVISEIVSDHGWSAVTIARILVFVLIYVAVIAAARPTVEAVDGGWVASRRVVALTAVVIVSLVGVALYLGGIQ